MCPTNYVVLSFFPYSLLARSKTIEKPSAKIKGNANAISVSAHDCSKILDFPFPAYPKMICMCLIILCRFPSPTGSFSATRTSNPWR